MDRGVAGECKCLNKCMSTQQYANRLLTIASEKARRRYPNGEKHQLLIYQLGFVIGLLARHAHNDTAIQKDVKNLEEQLGINFKE